jgi:hypothetical protein
MGEEQTWETRWRALSEAAFAEMTEWRRQHPTATMREIETAIDAHLAKVRAQMLQDTALASPTADLAGVPEPERPVCPACGQRLRLRGQRTRRLTTSHDQSVALTRSYAECPACGAGLFPPG